MENEKKTGESHVPLKKRHIEYLTSVGNGDTLEEPRVVVTEAKSSVVLDRSDHTPPGVPVSGKGHDVRVAALNVSNSTCPFTSLERTSSSSSMMSIFPMPPLLRSTTSWESLIGATATDAMAPPFFNFTTSRGHPLISEPIFDTPVITRTMPPAFFGSVPPQFCSEAIGNHSFGGASMRKGMFTGRKSTAGSLLTDNLPQPTPLSEISGMEMDECNVAEALLNLTPAVPARRVPFAEIGSQTTNSPAEKLYAIHSAGTHAASPDILKKRSRQLLENVPITDVPCKCKNSKCLKLYCVCFQTGKFCDGNLCKCKDCLNTEQHNGPGGKRSRAVKKILHRRIDAFDKRLKKKTGEGCSCKKTRCLRKYCNCLAIGVRCTSSCQCSDCENGPPSTNPSARGFGANGANGRLSRTGRLSQPTLAAPFSSQSTLSVPFSPILTWVNSVMPLQEDMSSPTETTTEYVTTFCSI